MRASTPYLECWNVIQAWSTALRTSGSDGAWLGAGENALILS
jgi:hypothetical protein